MAFFLVFDSPLPPCYAIYVIKCYGLAGLANPLPLRGHNVIYEWHLQKGCIISTFFLFLLFLSNVFSFTYIVNKSCTGISSTTISSMFIWDAKISNHIPCDWEQGFYVMHIDIVIHYWIGWFDFDCTTLTASTKES